MKRLVDAKPLLLVLLFAVFLTAMGMMPATVQAAAKSETLEVMNPFADRAEGFYKLAPRLDTLDGKTIGLLNQNKANSVYYMNALEDLLKKKYPNVKFKQFIKRPTAKGGVTWESFDFVWPKHQDAISVATHYHNRADLNLMKASGIDAVINAVVC